MEAEAQSSAPVAAPPEVVLLDGGREAFPRMLAAIAAARRYVYLESYIFELDTVGGEFVAALAAAARRGLSVSVSMDGWGSSTWGLKIASQLREAGCKVKIYNRLLTILLGRLRRNHRKLLVVDDEVAILGGINIGDEYARGYAEGGWADLAVEVRGNAARHLGAKVRGEKLAGSEAGAVRIWLSSWGGGRRLRQRYLKALGSARREVWMAQAYFIPDRGLMRSMTAAARRGVKLTLLLAGRSDVPFARAASMTVYRRLLKAGVEIYEWTASMLHAKAAVVDGGRMLVGSFNLDPFSLANLETLVEIHDKAVCGDGQAWIAAHIAKASLVRPEDCAGTWWQRWGGDWIGLLMARLAQLVGRMLRRG